MINQITLLILISVGFLFVGCQSERVPSEKLYNEYWKGYVHTDRVDIPFRFRITDSTLILVNNDELIQLELSFDTPDSVTYLFPLYDASLTLSMDSVNRITGFWNSFSRNFRLPFTAEPHDISSTQPTDSLYAQITFLAPDSSRSFPAIGAFAMEAERVSGTFLTETGDYRFMEGRRDLNSFELSTFDGDHLYYSTASLNGDNDISGQFYSGNNPPYTWRGTLTEHPELTPSDNITAISREDSTLSFRALALNGDSVSFSKENFEGYVTVVSAFGSWCPNCHDELTMYSELMRDLNQPGLQVIPVAFERQETVQAAAPVISRVVQKLNTPYPAYYAGKASKSFASHYFDGLGEIKAFPTSVIIDKRGKIRKVFSGFSGPGTGHFYIQHKEEVTRLISELLAE